MSTLSEIELVFAPVGDHDQAYTFGLPRQTANRAGPFTLRELTRLTILRSRLGAAINDPAHLLG